MRHSGVSLEEVAGAVGREVGDDMTLAVTKRKRRELRYAKLDGSSSRGAESHALRTCSAQLRSGPV
jgi:hypothetical protein